ncbi:hypothetical protein GCM10010171_22660 [Actinokineospora fastidiosa]|uniref:Uncharacterized protein n=1 Tax=Actinokineospora fastidiosa TaxID=1816 RepID=A0A918LCB5_9PSEU|nr:hypothetical protein GCM10010171_22660 [Actinokineospora fastidiosa]
MTALPIMSCTVGAIQMGPSVGEPQQSRPARAWCDRAVTVSIHDMRTAWVVKDLAPSTLGASRRCRARRVPGRGTSPAQGWTPVDDAVR